MPSAYASHEGITEYRLANGLRLLLIPDPSQATLTVNLTVFAGSAYEDYGETGAAHLLEHLAFKGSPDFPNVPAALNEHGASWNGTTWADRTNYYETMPASRENLDFGMQFEAARLTRCFIRAEDLETEMTVVRNEFESGENQPLRILSERMAAMAYLFHGYGHSTIGARSDIEDVPIERLDQFYRRWYRPDNALLVVAGRFDPEHALESSARHLEPLERPETPLRQSYTVEPAQDGERTVTLRRVGDVGAVGACYHVCGGGHADMAAIEVASELLAATPNGRLYRSLVETGEAVKVSGYVLQFRDPSLSEFVAEVPSDSSLERARDRLVEVIEGIAADPPDSAEVARAKNAILKDRTLVFASSERLAIEMSEWAAMGDWRLFFVHRDRLEKVDTDDVVRVAERYLRRSNRTLGLYVPADTPERSEVPPTGDIKEALAELVETSTAAQPVEGLGVDPDRLEERTRRESRAEDRIRLALLDKRTRGQLVTGRIAVVVGDETGLAGREELNEWVAAMLERGTRSRDRVAIKEQLDRLRAEVRVHGGPNATSIRFTTTRPNVEEVTRLLVEMLREPAFDAGEFDVLRRERIAELEEARHDPESLAVTALDHLLYPQGHLHHAPTVEEQLDWTRKLDIDALARFHADFYGAWETFVAVVGDHDPDAMVELVDGSLSGWTSRLPSAHVDVMCPPSVARGLHVIETPDKENAITVGGRTFHMTRDDPDYPAALLANYVIGGEALNSRLMQRLRQQDGLCYGAGSGVVVDSCGDLASFTAWAISAPQNTQSVHDAIHEELERVLADGLESAELERARTSFREALEVRLSRDATLAAEMIDQMLRGRTFADLHTFSDRLRTVSLEQVSTVLTRFVAPDEMLIIRAGDFRAIAVEPAEAAASAPS